MKNSLIAIVLGSLIALPAVAHDSKSHSRRPAPPAECAVFEGKDPKTIDLKDATTKAAYEKCEAARKAAKAEAEEQDRM